MNNLYINKSKALSKLRKKYSTKKQADSVFLDLYNSGLYLPKAKANTKLALAIIGNL